VTGRLYTMAETAELLGISLTALYELRRKRHIAIVEIPGTGKRSLPRVEASEIEAFKDRNRQPAAGRS
jgi:predicted site-specific integrase-resolvase